MDLQLLTEKLASALNESYDVTHMDTVISVIASLESSEITKEQLESTRLAKFINELRKKTTSENLARRSKNLLKRWREMVCHRPQVDFTDSNSNSNFHSLKKKRKKKSPSPPLCAVSDDLSLSNSSLTAPTLAMIEKTELTFTGRFAAAPSQIKNEGDPPPKKRGRKKGSRGVDAILTKNSIDQLLKTSKLLSVATGGQKKVKTTQELLADIQGRKCVDIPETSTSSGSSETFTPENSNMLLPNGNSPEFQNEYFQQSPVNEIESELEAIRAQLPSHSSGSSIESFSTVPCTCYIKEIEKNKNEVFKEAEAEENDQATITKPQKASLRTIVTKLTSVKREAIKKSIFDFDYEEGNDPLDEILREVKQEVINFDTSENVKLPITKFQDSIPTQGHVSLASMVKPEDIKNDQAKFTEIKQFEVVEDENCPAKDFFVIRVGKIGHRQIQSLHNFYIKNINGNEVDNERGPDRMNTDRIVPQYNHISFEWIPKNLSKWSSDVKLKSRKFNEDVFLGYVGKEKNNNIMKIKKNKKRKKIKPPLSLGELACIKLVNGDRNGYHVSDISDTPENSPLDFCTDDSSSSLGDFHQVTSSSNSVTSNRIILTIKKTNNKKRNCENKENLFFKNHIKINGLSIEKNSVKPLQVQKKDLISKITSLSDDFYLEKKFPALRSPSDETTIFMAHELSPLTKLIKLSDDLVVESAPAPASSSDTDETETESGSLSDNSNESDESSDETDTSSNPEVILNEVEAPTTRSVLVPEPNIIVPETSQNENFREWYETLQVRSYNDELLTILPYVIFD